MNYQSFNNLQTNFFPYLKESIIISNCPAYFTDYNHITICMLDEVVIEYKSLLEYFSQSSPFFQKSNSPFLKKIKKMIWSVFVYYIRRNFYPTEFVNCENNDKSLLEYIHNPNKVFQIHDFVNLRLLGQGGAGTISMQIEKETGKLYALKSFINRKLYLREKHAYQKIRHHSFISCCGHIKRSSSEKTNAYLVLQFLCFNTVKKAQKDYGIALNNTTKTKIVLRVLFGLDYLHSRGIMHRDIKISNVLLDYNHEAYISDFDSAREYSSNSNYTTNIGTFIYASPEEIESGCYSFQTDIYSFGLFIYELATGEPPFLANDISLLDIIKKIQNNEIPKLSSDYGPISNICNDCLSKDPKERAGIFYFLDYMTNFRMFFKNSDHIELLKYINELRKAHNPQTYRGDINFIIDECNKGDKSCQFYLGVMYYYGRGVEQDYSKSAHYYEMAANQGCSKAKFNLGRLFEEGKGVPKDFGKAFALYNESAELNNPNALNNLGFIYMKGNEEIEMDQEKGVKYYQMATELGNITACYNLGYLYLNGIYVEKNYKKALEYFKKAADLGNMQAQFFMGKEYENGIIFPKNIEMAKHYYYLSFINGNMKAAIKVSNLFYILGDKETAIEILTEQSYRKKNILALIKLGIIYYYNSYLETSKKYFDMVSETLNGSFWLGKIAKKEQNYDKSFEYFQLSSQKMFINAHYQLGKLYLKLNNDIDKAKYYFSLAAQKEHSMSLYYLGVISEIENGEKNDESINLYRKAACIFCPKAEEKLNLYNLPLQPNNEQLPCNPNLCTKKTSNQMFITQHIFECDTCLLNVNYGVCLICAKKCHKGHKLRDMGIKQNFQCDCSIFCVS